MIANFLSDFIKYLPAQFTPALVGFISIPVITKSFNAEQYGEYSLVLASLAILMTLAGWVPSSIIRFYSSFEREKNEDFVKTAIILALASNLMICFFSYLVIIVFQKNLSAVSLELFYIGIICFFLDSIFLTLQYFLRARRDAQIFTFYAVSQNFINLLFVLIAIFLKLPIQYLFLAKVVANLILLPFLIKSVIKLRIKSLINANYSKTICKQMVLYGFPLVIGNLAAWILSLSDRYVLEFFRGAQEVGIYSACYNLADKTAMFFNNLFMFASGPIAMIIWEKQGAERSKEYVAKISRYFILSTVPLCSLISLIARPLMELLTTKEYSVGANIIPLVVFGVFLLGLQGSFQSGVLFYKQTSKITWAIISSAIFNLILNIIFVPHFGYVASAVSTFLSYLVLLCLMILFSWKLFVWKFPFRSLINSFLSSSIASVVVLWANSYFVNFTFIHIFSTTIVYFTLCVVILWILGEFTKNEIFITKKIVVQCAHLKWPKL